MEKPKDQVLSDIRGKIDREIKLIQGFQAVKRNTSNEEVIQRCNNQIRETQTNINYLQETLEKLLIQGQKDAHVASQTPTGGGRPRVTSSVKPLYSRFDLIKYDCPSLGHKIQYMLQQLQFKLQVENKYREANEKISQLYLMDGDKSSSNAAEGGKFESDHRIQLLNKSLKKYQGMHVNVEEINRDLEIMNAPKFARKPLTGKLTTYITCIRDIDHIALPMFNKKPESIISIKIDDVERIRTNGSRSGKFNEEHTIDIDKAHELEITVYDKVGNLRVPVALSWILLSDIAEEIRKRKVAAESASEGWYSASNLQSSQGFKSLVTPASSGFEKSPVDSNSNPTQTKTGDSDKTLHVSAWVNLEPVGQILISLYFEKSSIVGSKFGLMGAIGRHGAIRQKKEEVFEQHGHQFVQKQFYNIMCCALCGEFLRYTGFQCQDCRFLCHKKCYQKVVTKCISKSSTTDDDEAKLNHRIPHRFEPVLNRGTKWCCHCGHILPWGKKNVRKCSECGVMCHAQCTHLVPDFCGMSMDMANKILMTIKSTKTTAKALPAKPKERLPALPSSSREPSSSPLKAKPQQSLPVPPSSRAGMQSSSHPSLQTSSQQFQVYDGLHAQKVEYLEDDDDKAYESRLQTTSTHQFQPSVEVPHSRQGRRPPPQAPIEDLNAAGDYGNRTHGHRNYPEYGYHQQVPEELHQEQNPFEAAERTADSRQQHFENFEYNDDVSQIIDDRTSASINDKPSSESVREQEVISSSRESGSRSHRRRRRRKIGLDDFQFLAVLGKGNFGKVMLAESRHTQNLCAIKVLKKDFIVENEEAESVKSEKRVFLTANKEMHPFLLNLHCCFQTENRIYFVMEYVSGGDLMWHIQKARFSARRAKFYACEVLLALKYFHDNGIVYRDLKLDNILLTTKGHIKIADYGLCKENMWHGVNTGTFCGTPDFMAPEIVAGKQYDRSVDWWALGVLIFQMLLCQSPFKGDDQDDVFNAIEHDEVKYPVNMPGETVLLLQALLTKDPSLRLGSGERDAIEIMEHPYFADVNFDDVLNMRIQPPYLPEVNGDVDLSNFDQEFTSETPRLTPVETVLTSEMQEQFRGFSHIADEAPV